jgi:hypothetical protein
MSESASVDVLSAEVRVLQVGKGQLTRSMYWQLDEAAPKQFQPFGRVKDNKRRLKDGVLLVGRDSKTAADRLGPVEVTDRGPRMISPSGVRSQLPLPS